MNRRAGPTSECLSCMKCRFKRHLLWYKYMQENCGGSSKGSEKSRGTSRIVDLPAEPCQMLEIISSTRVPDARLLKVISPPIFWALACMLTSPFPRCSPFRSKPAPSSSIRRIIKGPWVKICTQTVDALACFKMFVRASWAIR